MPTTLSKGKNPQSNNFINKVTKPGVATVQKTEVIKQQPQRYQEMKQQKFVNAGSNDANVTASTALGGAVQNHVGSGKNF